MRVGYGRKPDDGTSKIVRIVALVVLCVTIFLYVVSIPSSGVPQRLSLSRETVVANEPLTLAVEGEKITYVVASPKKWVPIRGILFVAHGCSHSATDFSDCPTCANLPVERRIVEEALNRDFLTVAISSKNRETKCWSAEDIPRVMLVLEKVVVDHEVDVNVVPVFALGASSGGFFVSKLASFASKTLSPIRIKAVVIQVMAIQDVSEFTAPHFFIMMQRDLNRLRQIQAAERIFRFYEIPVEIRIAAPRKLTPAYFSKPYDALSDKLSARAVQMLQSSGFLDAEDMLREDPRKSDWQSVLREVARTRSDWLVADQSGISELMNVAWAMHEITDEYLNDAFDFLEEQSKS